MTGIETGFRITGNGGRSRVFSALKTLPIFECLCGGVKKVAQGPRTNMGSGEMSLKGGGQSSLNLSFPTSAMQTHKDPFCRNVLESHVGKAPSQAPRFHKCHPPRMRL